METPIQKLFNYIQTDWDGDGETLLFHKKEMLQDEKKAFVNFGNSLLEKQTGGDGCGCGKDGGGDAPENLFDKIYES